MRRYRRKRKGLSYRKRVEEINAIYDRWVKHGLSNREIWRRYIYPRYGVSERSFYNLLNASANPNLNIKDESDRELLLFNFEEK